MARIVRWRKRLVYGVGPGTGPLMGPPGAARNRAPGKDWESVFNEEDRVAEIQGLKRRRDIAEGLNLAGRSIAGLGGAKIPEFDDAAYGIREDIGEAQDELSGQERQMLASYGLQIPKGMKRSRLVSMGIIPQHFAQQRAGVAERGRLASAQETSSRQPSLAHICRPCLAPHPLYIRQQPGLRLKTLLDSMQ